MSQLTVTNLRAGSTPQEVITSGRALTNITSATFSGALTVGGTSTLTGRVGVGAAPTTTGHFVVQGIPSGLSGGARYGVVSDPTFGSGTISSGSAFLARVNSEAASFTMASGYAFRVLDGTAGTGSTITTQYGLYVESLTAGTNNYAIYTNTGLVRFGDKVSIGSGAASTYQLNVYSADTADDARIGLKTSTSYTAIIEQSNASLFSITNNAGYMSIAATGTVTFGGEVVMDGNFPIRATTINALPRSAPGAPPSGWYLYTDSTTGDLMAKSANGVVVTLAVN